jgi:hypothetical protein
MRNIITKKPKTNLKLETKVVKDIFVTFLALNALGYNDENNKGGMHPARKKARNILQKYNWNKKYPHLKKDLKKTGPWYLIRTLLEKSNNIKRIKISNNSFVLNLKNFTKEPLIKKAWKVFKNYHLKEAQKLFPIFKKEIIRMIAFINKSPENLKKIILIPNLLDAYWRGYGLKIENIGYIVVGPGAEKNHGELIRHELLHILVPQYRVPLHFIFKKDHRQIAKLGYTSQNIIRREYIILSLNLLYESEILKKNIEQAIIRKKRYFPHLQEVIEIIKKRLTKLTK